MQNMTAWCDQAASHCLISRWPSSWITFGITRDQWVNYHVKISKLNRCLFMLSSLSYGRFEGNFIKVNFKLVLMIDGSGISVEIDFRLILLDLTNDNSTLVQVMAWCRQATSRYLSQWRPCSTSPYGVTRRQWVNVIFIAAIWKVTVYFWNATVFCCGYVHCFTPSTLFRYNWLSMCVFGKDLINLDRFPAPSAPIISE